MRWFIKYIGLLFIVLLVTTTLTLFIGRIRPAPPQLDLLHLKNCKLPCWIGILPGKTTIGEAQMLIGNVYPASDYLFVSNNSSYADGWVLTITPHKDSNFLSVEFNAGSDQSSSATISQISISVSGMPNYVCFLSIGDWLNLLGPPNSLSVTWGNHMAWPALLYREQGVVLTLNNLGGDFTVGNLHQQICNLDIYSDLEHQYGKGNVVWHGLRSSNNSQLLASIQG